MAAWRDGYYQASLTSRGTGVYLLMMDELYHLTFEDDLGPGLTEKLIPAEMGIKAFWKLLPDQTSAWFDDDRTNARERRRDLVLEAARNAVRCAGASARVARPNRRHPALRPMGTHLTLRQ